MNVIVAAFLSGFLFAIGLLISGMADPARVLGFLDVAGAWDPSLVFVMGGAVPVAAIGFAYARKIAKPLLADRFRLPERKDLDARLVAGSAIFGVGWGLVGYCPGPALVGLGSGRIEAAIFVAAMLVGLIGGRHGLPVLMQPRRA